MSKHPNIDVSHRVDPCTLLGYEAHANTHWTNHSLHEKISTLDSRLGPCLGHVVRGYQLNVDMSILYY